MDKNKRVACLRRRRFLLIFIVLLSNIFTFYDLQNKIEIQICLLSIIFSNIVGISIVVIIINNMIKHEQCSYLLPQNSSENKTTPIAEPDEES